MSNFSAKLSNLWYFTNSGKEKMRISFMPEMPKETEPTLLTKLLFSFQGPTLKTFVQTLPLTSKHLSDKSLGPFGMLQA